MCHWSNWLTDFTVLHPGLLPGIKYILCVFVFVFVFVYLYLSGSSHKQHWQHLPRPQILSSVLEEGSWLPIERGEVSIQKDSIEEFLQLTKLDKSTFKSCSCCHRLTFGQGMALTIIVLQINITTAIHQNVWGQKLIYCMEFLKAHTSEIVLARY